MAKPGRATQEKRGRELAKQDKRKAKEERRVERKDQKSNSGRGHPDGVDPDLIGIFPGPQPVSED